MMMVCGRTSCIVVVVVVVVVSTASGSGISSKGKGKGKGGQQIAQPNACMDRSHETIAEVIDDVNGHHGQNNTMESLRPILFLSSPLTAFAGGNRRALSFD
jgi:hypothetical protein